MSPDTSETEQAIELPPGGGALTLTCYRCTRWAHFLAATELAAKVTAKAKGWKFVGDRTVCRKCPS